MRENGCPWNEYTCAVAAEHGHFDVLKWMRENGCPWNESTCLRAAETGKLEILKWARKNGCPWNKQECHEVAVNEGHTDVVAWLASVGRRFGRRGRRR
jgi:hypothetical protein